MASNGRWMAFAAMRYSNDNDGAGYLLCQFPGARPTSNNVVRHNLSQNDGRRNSYGGLELFGSVQKAEIYNNTVFVDANAQGSPVPVEVGSGSGDVSFRNNAFYADNGLPVLRIQMHQDRLLFQGNAYIATAGAVKIEWQNSDFTTLSEWRAATGEEKVAGRNVGIETHARVVSSKQGRGDVDALLSPYRSNLIDTGLDLRTLFGLDPGKRDDDGSPIPIGSTFDIGAREWRLGR